MASQLENVVGDVLLASSFISYAGPFSKRYRETMINQDFLSYILKKQIPKSHGLSPI